MIKEQESGIPTAKVGRRHGISSASFYKYKAKYGGMDVSDARKLKVLEEENAKLKKLLAEKMLDNAVLKDIASKKMVTPVGKRDAVAQAIEHHRRKVRFYSTVELVNALEQEKAMGKAGKLAEMLTKTDLVILDELGYLPFSPSGGALLFHLLSKLYERTSVIITTNLSFSEWLRFLGMPK